MIPISLKDATMRTFLRPSKQSFVVFHFRSVVCVSLVDFPLLSCQRHQKAKNIRPKMDTQTQASKCSNTCFIHTQKQAKKQHKSAISFWTWSHLSVNIIECSSTYIFCGQDLIEINMTTRNISYSLFEREYAELIKLDTKIICKISV